MVKVDNMLSVIVRKGIDLEKKTEFHIGDTFHSTLFDLTEPGVFEIKGFDERDIIFYRLDKKTGIVYSEFGIPMDMFIRAYAEANQSNPVQYAITYDNKISLYYNGTSVPMTNRSQYNIDNQTITIKSAKVHHDKEDYLDLEIIIEKGVDIDEDEFKLQLKDVVEDTPTHTIKNLLPNSDYNRCLRLFRRLLILNTPSEKKEAV